MVRRRQMYKSKKEMSRLDDLHRASPLSLTPSTVPLYLSTDKDRSKDSSAEFKLFIGISCILIQFMVYKPFILKALK